MNYCYLIDYYVISFAINKLNKITYLQKYLLVKYTVSTIFNNSSPSPYKAVDVIFVEISCFSLKEVCEVVLSWSTEIFVI